ncbi:MAG: hypothetical protein KIT43_02215 [Bauldia sp.]|nr:hypothetical protein [Bauldia sp.]
MAEPENHTLTLLREMRTTLNRLDRKVDQLDKKVDQNHVDVRSRLDNLRQALNGEASWGVTPPPRWKSASRRSRNAC